MKKMLKNAKLATKSAILLSTHKKNKILLQMARALKVHEKEILRANKLDIIQAKKDNLSSALIDRLLLDKNRIHDMAISLKNIATLEEPIGKILKTWELEKGLIGQKVSTPIGVIGIIYESRPNVTSDTAGLCFKSSNVCVLKGGKEAKHSNFVIANILQNVLAKNNLPREMITLIEGSRKSVEKLVKMDNYIDLIIPRGGEGLVKFVSQNSSIPVIKHDKGLCHLYIDKSADIKKAINIAINAKCQRTGVCNAIESLLVHEDIANKILPQLKKAFDEQKTFLKGCSKTRKIIKISKATKEDFKTEYLSNILSIKIVKNINEAIEHITIYGSKHSEAIISENKKTTELFLNSIDASCVYVNASTRFTDGGLFGLGAEIGISTNKLHARGPVGANDLTTYKYKIYGKGHIRK